jgi:Tol biopolymer transport system component
MFIPVTDIAIDPENIVYSAVYSGKWELWSAKPDGSGLIQVADTIDDEHFQPVSPDGKKMLFIDAKRNHLLSGLTWR